MATIQQFPGIQIEVVIGLDTAALEHLQRVFQTLRDVHAMGGEEVTWCLAQRGVKRSPIIRLLEQQIGGLQQEGFAGAVVRVASVSLRQGKKLGELCATLISGGGRLAVLNPLRAR
jgi:hypothetical protein